MVRAPVTTETPAVTTSTVDTVPAADQLADFGRSEALVGGEAWTVAIAATRQERARGLMGVTDFGDVDGMLFLFEGESSGGFWMKDTLLPLDIAFFTADGVLVDVLSMVPCEEDPCPIYTPSGSYLFALETLPGRFDEVPEELTLVLGS
jgi:uncharacterized membrane protein (UPF0127 family)